MGNPKGSNAGTVGVKGKSGRKSAYEEQETAQKIIDAWHKGIDMKKIKKFFEKFYIEVEDTKGNKKWKLNLDAKGKFKLWDLWLYRTLMSGNGGELQKMFDKLVPDIVKLQGDEDKPLYPPIKITTPSPKKK